MKSVRWVLLCAAVFANCAIAVPAGAGTRAISQTNGASASPNAKADSLLLPDSPKPTFTIPEKTLRKPVTLIAYGDMRFTNPKETTATDPKIRAELVRKVAEERPDVLLLNGDVPWHGGTKNDYAVFKDETRIWREKHLRVFPALGNHEFSLCDAALCLGNWWDAFPKMKGRRWYSVQVGTKIFVIALDTDDSLEPDSRQIKWLSSQLNFLPRKVEFVLITLHHPPVADPNPGPMEGRNPRPNEVALKNYLSAVAPAHKAKIVVVAGHVHNYERFFEDGVTYLVSGGGGATPYPVFRAPADLYQDPKFPNYNYVKFVLEDKHLRATMYRLSSTGAWQVKDTFQVRFP
jgi:predicted phosphohydrolase